MSQDDVERVDERGAAFKPEQIAAELGGMFMRLATETEDDAAMRRINTARAAAALIRAQAERLSAMPGRELLADALEALQGLHDDVVEYVTLNKLHDADGSPAINNHWMRRARAAADKIRAAMTQETQP